MAIAVFTPMVAACASDDATAGDQATQSGGTAATDTTAASHDSAGTETSSGSGEDSTPAGDELRWARADLGFVSAYVLARGNSAAIVDTGGSGSAGTIGESLQSLGLNYSNVEHLILTHKHGDHIGSMGEVVAEATSATVYAGEADLDGIDEAPLGGDQIVPLIGGEDIFGFEVVATPGHTAGHMSVIDHDTGLLLAGDAIFTEDGGVIEGPERFFSDVPRSRQTIRDLAALSFNTLLVGHGDPIEANADTAVADLAASLP